MYNVNGHSKDSRLFPMKYSIESYLGSNITVVFDALELSAISRDNLRTITGQSAIMDMPDMIVILNPSGPVIQIGNRRVIVIDKSQSQPGELDVWSPAFQVSSLIQGSNCSAFGFNYDIRIKVEDISEVEDYMNERFIPTSTQLESEFEVSNLTFIPSFTYHRGEVRYDLKIEPIDSKILIAHLNSHFANKLLPDENQLAQNYINEFDEINRMLSIL